jgi:hypothetical protein
MALIFHNKKELIPEAGSPGAGYKFPRRFLKGTWAKSLA